ncbi:MAG UNVERIFIED_CONTAM: hypothetical protein LVT10_01250 [Anaerolineae bacterium]|jgi:hypothetical protein
MSTHAARAHEQASIGQWLEAAAQFAFGTELGLRLHVHPGDAGREARHRHPGRVQPTAQRGGDFRPSLPNSRVEELQQLEGVPLFVEEHEVLRRELPRRAVGVQRPMTRRHNKASTISFLDTSARLFVAPRRRQPEVEDPGDLQTQNFSRPWQGLHGQSRVAAHRGAKQPGCAGPSVDQQPDLLSANPI